MKILKKIYLIYPKKYSSVESVFELVGLVPISWISDGGRISNRLSLDILDIKGQVIAGMSAEVHLRKGFFTKYKRKARFRAIIQLDKFAAPFVIESQGLMTLRLQGVSKDQDYFIPICVKSINRNFRYNKDLLKSHRNIKKIVYNNNKRYREYMDTFGEIWERKQKKIDLSEYAGGEYSSINDANLNFGMFGIIEESFADTDDKLSYEEEDLELQKLEEKYKDVIELEGPLLGGNALQHCGFDFVIHSNDHDMHLHVIHKGRGVDVRIGFPELKILSYKKGKLRTKDEKRILDFLRVSENFNSLKNEFERREKALLD